MRGVYGGGHGGRERASGSSPRVRGLHRDPYRQCPRRRIIPACAGFTWWRPGPWPGPGDHPRVRGVYRPDARHAAGPRGSSPRARGLPARGTSRGWYSGIIPACAGFTLVPTSPYATLSDHPRVRGVYPTISPTEKRIKGSSPHARGLRGRRAHGVGGLGIIPACAGFTGIAETKP